MTKPDGYTKAKRRLFTKYSRRLESALRRAVNPSAIETRRETWGLLRSATGWAPWLVVDPAQVSGGLPVVFVDDLDLGRFRVVEKRSEVEAA